MEIEIDLTTSTNVHTSFKKGERECLDCWRNDVKANTICNYCVPCCLPIIRIFDNLKLNLQYLGLRIYEIRLYLYFIFISQMSIFNFHRTWLVFQLIWIISDITEFLEQAKLQIPALNVITINVSHRINIKVNKKSVIGEAPNGDLSGIQRSEVLLVSDLDLNCLQRLSADNTSRHSHFLLSAVSTHPNITEKLTTRFNSLPHIFPHCEINSIQRVFHSHHNWVAVSNEYEPRHAKMCLREIDDVTRYDVLKSDVNISRIFQ